LDKQIEKMMKTLHITEAEARSLVEDDERIEKGEKLFELSAEQKKVAKTAHQGDRKVYQWTQRKRKPDDDKRELIQNIKKMLENLNADNIFVENEQKIVTFEYNSRKFKLDLIATREKKAQK